MYVQNKEDGLVGAEVGRGADKNATGLLGYSSNVSKKQALHVGLATAVMAAKINPTNNAQRHNYMDETQLLKHTELVTNVSNSVFGCISFSSLFLYSDFSS